MSHTHSPVSSGASAFAPDAAMLDYDVYRALAGIIFGSLDIATVLENLADYLKKFLPLSGIALLFFNIDQGEMEILTETSASANRRLTKKYPLHLSLADHLREELATPGFALSPCLYNNSQFGDLWPSAYSSLVVPLFASESRRVFCLTIYCMEAGAYTENDLRLVASIRQPLTMAFANLLEYERLSSDLSSEKDELSRRNHLLAERTEGAVQELLSDSSDVLRPLLEALPFVAESDGTVLIVGETGVGKELFASAVHQLSRRKSKPFVKVNCGGIPESLIDSALFGHEKGAFTGAVAQHRGFFEQAQGGTIFLDEIGELPLTVQTRLLRVLQFKEIQRVGGQGVIRLNIRIIAATHRDLPAMIKEGAFREDLWFRLNILPMHIPPLRERRDDIPRYASQILRKKCREMNIRSVPLISAGSMARLQAYPWPGNLREMENLIERMLILNRDAFNLESVPTTALQPEQDPWPQPPAPDAFSDAPTANPFPSLDDAMRAHIARALQRSGGKIQGPSGAAALLGLNPSTLRFRMKKLNMR